jgi:hypothetical protein
MMILHNFSVETDCCNCCKDDPYARIPQPIMDSINNGKTEDKIANTISKGETKGKILEFLLLSLID